MKFFHLSDLHIGLKLFNRDLSEDQAFILDQIIKNAKKEQPDAVAIAGDIYDRAVPSAEAVELFDHFIDGLCTAVPDAAIMMISGNHDSGARLDVYRDILKRQNLFVIGEPPMSPEDHIEKVTLADAYGDVNFYLLPFVKPSMMRQLIGCDEDGNNFSYDETLHKLLEREQIDRSKRNVLVSHQFYLPKGKLAGEIERMDSEICTVGDIDQVRSDVLEPFDYAALGHIHKPMKVGNENYRYCGTPLACSLSEAGQKKAILEVKLKEKGQIDIREIPLKPLHEIRKIEGSLEEVLKMACDDYVSVTLTDQADLDILDMQDQVNHAFLNLLEIRRDTGFALGSETDVKKSDSMDPFSLCQSFLGETDDEDEELLKDVINTVLEEDQ